MSTGDSPSLNEFGLGTQMPTYHNLWGCNLSCSRRSEHARQPSTRKICKTYSIHYAICGKPSIRHCNGPKKVTGNQIKITVCSKHEEYQNWPVWCFKCPLIAFWIRKMEESNSGGRRKCTIPSWSEFSWTGTMKLEISMILIGERGGVF